MSNLVEDIISALECEFNVQPSYKNSVMTSDGQIVRITRDLWVESPILREHFVSGTSYKVLTFPESVLLALVRAYEEGTFPDGIEESYNLLAAASELELQDLTSKCFDNLRAINALDESVDFPSSFSVETVMRVFKVFLSSPLRTADIYKGQLSRIGRYCKNNRDVMTNAMNVLRQSLEKFKRIGLEGIPANFATQSMAVAIYKRMGELQTAVILGKTVVPVNLFGDRFQGVDVAKIRCFHLKYGQYLLYWNGFGEDVFYKKLQDDSAPTRVLRACGIFKTKGEFVFAAQRENDRTAVSLWMDDKNFGKIYQHHSDIWGIDFDYTRNVLAVLQRDSKLLLFRLKDKTLFLLEERETPERTFGVFLSERNTFAVRNTGGQNGVETYCYPAAGGAESGRSNGKQPHEITLLRTSENFQAWFSLTPYGGKYFLTDNGRLELVLNFPNLARTVTLMTRGELCALSELWMSP